MVDIPASSLFKLRGAASSLWKGLSPDEQQVAAAYIRGGMEFLDAIKKVRDARLRDRVSESE